jgi:hypothetical protein
VTPATRTLAGFAAAGGIVVPLLLTLARAALRALGAEADGALAILADVRLSLWPMSRLFDAADAGRHWLYLPLAAVLSNALIYAAVGSLAAWGRTSIPAFAAAVALAAALPLAAHLAFGTGVAGAAVAIAIAVTALLAHRFARRSGE